MANTEYTAEGFDQDVIDERIEALLEVWGVDTDPDECDDDAVSRLERERQRAYEIAASFPSAIATGIFVEYVAEGLVGIA